ncbi:heterokaryon incompatibility protein-domain-containing protein [Ilyonectria sp. MPI-CAGE-AT-0026]|nr:heterokaryon incompatibility protein-domain-containing protein [Ilyonectria sp. MPI-CAGE-AT-0026]
MSLCGACVDLAKNLSNLISAGHEDTSSQKPIRHDRPFRQVRDVDNNSCPMCSLLQSRYTREGEDSPLDDSFSAEVVPCWVRDDAPGVGTISKPHRYVLRTLFVSVRRDRSGLGNLEDGTRVYPPVPLQLFAPRGCPESLGTSVWREERLVNSSLQDSLALCQTWFKSCLENHTGCHESGFGSASTTSQRNRLPTRVLDTAPTSSRSSLRLVESNGMQGTWAALSHCWGKPENRPLTTTRANLRKHLSMIEFASLPKTFQDAVLLARALGIRYLWIDSLCIIQDDKNDWKSESNKMGAIYQNAAITFAAADAQDSTEGCFVDGSSLSYTATEQFSSHPNDETGAYKLLAVEESPEVSSAARLPFFMDDKLTGSFFVAPWPLGREQKSHSLEESPLFKRAWVMQEWALSRRTLIFQKSSILWSCRAMCTDERGYRLEFKRPSLQNWGELVEEYTKMDSTFKSDRLIAIQGLANLFQQQRGDMYFAGMWTADLPESLLWKVSDYSPTSPDRERPHLPSWTWANLEGPIRFQLSGEPFRTHHQEHLSNTLEELSVRPSGALYLKGPVTHLKSGTLDFVARTPRFSHPYKSFFKTDFKGYSNCRQNRGSIYGKQMVVIPGDRSLSPPYKNPERAGWAIMDLDVVQDCNSVYCIAVKKETNAICRLSNAEFFYEDVYHVILLQPVTCFGLLRRYVRIGIGVVAITSRLWHQEEVEIV